MFEIPKRILPYGMAIIELDDKAIEVLEASNVIIEDIVLKV